MTPSPPLRVAASLFLVLTLTGGAQGAPMASEVASVPGTASIGIVRLPDKQAGAKELSHSLGKDVEGVVREEVTVSLVAIRAFTAVVPAEGAFTLDLEIGAFRRTRPDPAAPADRMPLAFELEGRWTWKQGASVLKSGTTTIQVERILGELPQRADVAALAREALRELGLRAFADFYEWKDSSGIDAKGQAPGTR